jgi:hypothetical protein
MRVRLAPRRSAGIAVAAIALSVGCGPSTWRNYLREHEVEATRRAPGSSIAVLDAVREAVAAQPPRRIRAVGSGHSSAEVAQPSEGHDYVDVGLIDRVMGWDYYRAPDPRYVRIGAGATIAEVNETLAGMSPPRALYNMGNYDAQTIAGAFSTGTHGSGLDHALIADRLVAIEIVTDERHPQTGDRVQRLLRIERTDGVTDAAAFGSGHSTHADADVRVMELEQSDEVFDAAMINLGCFGVIVAVTVDTRDAFWLEEDDTFEIWNPEQPPNLQALAEANREFLQLTLVPHAMMSGDHEGQVVYRQTIRTARPVGNGPPTQRPRSREDFGRWLAETFSTGTPEFIQLEVPRTGLGLIARTFQEQADAPPWASRSDIVSINSLAPEIDATSIEIFVPLDTAVQAIDRIITLARQRGTDEPGPVFAEWWHTSPLGIRFVGQSRALLSPTHDGPRMAIEIPLLYDLSEGRRTRALHVQYRDRMLHTLETELTCDALRGRPHWGQRNWMGHDRAARMYGQSWDRWVAQYRRFNAFGTFSNAFTERMGLDGDSPCGPAQPPVSPQTPTPVEPQTPPPDQSQGT